MSSDQEMLHAAVLAVAKRMEAVEAAYDLLREHEGGSIAELYEEDRDTYREVVKAREALDLPVLEGNDADPAEDLDDFDEDARLDHPLEVSVLGVFRDGSWEVTGCEVTVCTGGPHIEIEYDGCSMRLNGYWGGSRVQGMPVDAPAAASILDEMMSVAESESKSAGRCW